MGADMILIVGVTASGKGTLAFGLAERIGGEIISVDSMKVYRRMDIGTAKPSIDARNRVKYHLIDVVEPSEFFSVAAYLELAEAAIEEIQAGNKPVIAVGGTAMYLKALLFGLFEGPGTDKQIRSRLKKRVKEEGPGRLHTQLAELDPVAAGRIDPNDARRIIRALEVYELTGRPISSLQTQFSQDRPRHDWTIIGLRRERPDAAHRINLRVKKMMEQGLVDEVKSLLAEEKPLSQQAKCAIGYAEIIEHLNGGCSLDEAFERIKKNTRKFAKAQRTWFRSFKNVHWLDVAPDEPAEKILERATAILEQAGD